MNEMPDQRRGRGMSILLILVLLFLAGALVAWAYLENSAAAPDPADTGVPSAMPG